MNVLEQALNGATEREYRFKCLQIAQAGSVSDDDAVKRARKYADFVLSKSDAEIIRAAEGLAEKVKPSVG